MSQNDTSLKGLGAGRCPAVLLPEPYGTAHLLRAKPNASFGGTSPACRWALSSPGSPFCVLTACPVPVQVVMVVCLGQPRTCANRNQKGGVPVVLRDVPSRSQYCSPGHPHPEKVPAFQTMEQHQPLVLLQLLSSISAPSGPSCIHQKRTRG